MIYSITYDYDNKTITIVYEDQTSKTFTTKSSYLKSNPDRLDDAIAVWG